MVFPGPLVKKFAEVLYNLDKELTKPSQAKSEQYQFSQKFFYKYIDAKNTERVVLKVKELLKN